MAAKSILLVEDELLLCWIVEEALVEEGHRVTIATTGNGGREALEAANSFDLLITNIRLKDGPDGWSLSRLARDRQPDIPVLYVTGDSVAQHPDEGVPGSVILSKPFDPDALRSTVAGLLESGRGTCRRSSGSPEARSAMHGARVGPEGAKGYL